jgi:hypothetical protein
MLRYKQMWIQNILSQNKSLIILSQNKKFEQISWVFLIACFVVVVVFFSSMSIFSSFQGAFFGIIMGHLCGIARLVVELIYPAPPCGEADDRPAFLTKLHYSYYVQLQLLFTAIMIVVISLCTRSRSEDEVCYLPFTGLFRFFGLNQ